MRRRRAAIRRRGCISIAAPSINGPGTTTPVPTAQAIRAVFDWFFDNGGPGAIPLSSAPTIPGVTPQIADGLSSPSAWEYATGVARVWGARASVRADLLVRHYVDFYMRQADTTTGRVQDPTGRSFDLSLVTNAPDGLLSRDYAGATFTASYRFGRTLDIGGNYTLSKASGNFDAENVASGPVPFDYRYPEYKQASWNFPDGDLAVDQRHRARLWANYTPGFLPGLTLSVLQALESGVPYGAANTNGVDPRPYVTNPNDAYLTPPSSTATTYFFGPRDEFHTEGQIRTDFATNYILRIPGAGPDAAVRTAAGVERLQPVPAVRVRQHGVRHRQRRQRRRRQPAAARHDGADARHDRLAIHRVQPVHDHPGPRRELGLRSGLRHRAQPLRLHYAAHGQDVVRSEVLADGLWQAGWSSGLPGPYL